MEVVLASGAEEPNSDMTSAHLPMRFTPHCGWQGNGPSKMASLARPTVHIAKSIVNFDINSDRYSSIEVVNTR